MHEENRFLQLCQQGKLEEAKLLIRERNEILTQLLKNKQLEIAHWLKKIKPDIEWEVVFAKAPCLGKSPLPGPIAVHHQQARKIANHGDQAPCQSNEDSANDNQAHEDDNCGFFSSAATFRSEYNEPNSHHVDQHDHKQERQHDQEVENS